MSLLFVSDVICKWHVINFRDDWIKWFVCVPKGSWVRVRVEVLGNGGTHWTLADTPFEVACLLIFGLRKISILRRSLPAGLLRDYQFLLMPGDVCGWKNMEGNEGNWAGITRLMADSWGKSGGNLHTSITSRFPAFIIIFRELTCSSTGSRCDRCLIANAQRQSCPGAV